MANQRLMKKVAPVVLSAAVAMTSMPAIAFAADFSDTEVTVAEESADIEEASAEAADTDVVEDTEDTDVDVEEAVVMFRQVYMGLSFEMAFLGGLDTQLLSKHLHAIYSLLKS